MVKLLIALAHICVVAGQWHIGSVSEWGEAGSLSLDVPSGAQADDLLVLTVQRTDDFLVTKMLGWTRAASCYKTNNGQSRCLEAQDCPSSQVIKDEDLGYEYCRNWGDKGNGRDLATIMLMRKRSSFSGSTVNIDMRGNHPSWATLTVLRGVDAAVRSSEGASCDRVRQSKFPSVSGKTGDVLLLSMGFDDTTRYEKFQAPSSTQKLDFVWGDDEAGQLPDGEKIQIGSSKFKAPEILFNPELIGSEELGVHDLLFNSIRKSDLDLRKTLYNNIVLSGGSTLVRGLGDRLLSELRRPSPKDTKIRISAPQERLYATWIGGSILASLDNFKRIWVTKKEWESEGARALHRKTL